MALLWHCGPGSQGTASLALPSCRRCRGSSRGVVVMVVHLCMVQGAQQMACCCVPQPVPRLPCCHGRQHTAGVVLVGVGCSPITAAHRPSDAPLGWVSNTPHASMQCAALAAASRARPMPCCLCRLQAPHRHLHQRAAALRQPVHAVEVAVGR